MKRKSDCFLMCISFDYWNRNSKYYCEPTEKLFRSISNNVSTRKNIKYSKKCMIVDTVQKSKKKTVILSQVQKLISNSFHWESSHLCAGKSNNKYFLITRIQWKEIHQGEKDWMVKMLFNNKLYCFIRAKRFSFCDLWNSQIKNYYRLRRLLWFKVFWIT